MTRLGLTLLGVLAAIMLAAPWLRGHDPVAMSRDHVLAPPTAIHLRDASGRWQAPFIRRTVVVDRLARTYAEDPSAWRPLVGRAPEGARAHDVPWHPLGTDSLGRDVWSRLVTGGRLSLGLAALAAVAALALGVLAGGAAGYAGGLLDTVLMRACELVVVLPAFYVVLLLRASLPLVLPASTVFWAMTAVLAVAGTPQVARAVRAVVAAERDRDYVVSATATGRHPLAVFLVHVLPAAWPVVIAQGLLLVPAFVLAEATLSFLGLGFDATAPSWGTALQEAANIRAIAEYPWVLAPAVAIFVTVLALTLVADGRQEAARGPLA